jgi:hypothetical protein
MYLNIINNISYESKRKSKKLLESDNQAADEETIEEFDNINQTSVRAYYSIFYGDLTKNWIKLKP